LLCDTIDLIGDNSPYIIKEQHDIIKDQHAHFP
jgi:hypothetical protein